MFGLNASVRRFAEFLEGHSQRVLIGNMLAQCAEPVSRSCRENLDHVEGRREVYACGERLRVRWSRFKSCDRSSPPSRCGRWWCIPWATKRDQRRRAYRRTSSVQPALSFSAGIRSCRIVTRAGNARSFPVCSPDITIMAAAEAYAGFRVGEYSLNRGSRNASLCPPLRRRTILRDLSKL